MRILVSLLFARRSGEILAALNRGDHCEQDRPEISGRFSDLRQWREPCRDRSREMVHKHIDNLPSRPTSLARLAANRPVLDLGKIVK